MKINIIPNSSIKIYLIDSYTRSVGRADINITIAGITKQISFHVVQHFRYPVLLGLDAGERFGLRIDLSNRKVTMCSPSTKKRFVALHLEPADNKVLDSILNKHNKVFSQDSNDIGRISVVKHSIKTIDHPPIQLRPYRRPQFEYDRIRTQVADLKAKNLIRDSTSPWAFPALLADKKDDPKSRLCGDYRPLNEITIDDKMPMPRIHEVLDRLSGATIFTTLDVAWGYWHIEMSPESIEKTAFVTNEGHYEWLVMPFGLKNAPATFQRVIQQILAKHLYKGVINYLDDIILYSKTFTEHMTLLDEVLTILESHGIKLKLKKCFFAKTEVNYLGHTISHNSVRPSKEKIAALKSFPVPTTVRQVRRFYGLAQHYRRFIQNFATLSRPLTQLLRKDKPFVWGEEQQRAFKTLIELMSTEPVLAMYDPNKQCKVYTDASKDGIGAIITQTNDKNEEHPIEYFSRGLTQAQQNYCATDLECLAVVEALEHFESYLSLPFTIVTDHSALQWLYNTKKPKRRHFSWLLKLSSYPSRTIVHRPGKAQQHVDALSRVHSVLHLTTDELIEAQSKADLSFVQRPINFKGIISVKHRNLTKAVVPPELRPKLLEQYHENHSHPGRNKTAALITPYYWWPNIHVDIKNHVNSCKTCQITKYPNKPSPGRYISPNPDIEPFDIAGIDTIVMGPAANNTHHKYIQVIIDHHSRFIWAFPTKSNKCEVIVTLLTNLLNSNIRFRTILTDCHKNFTGRALKDFVHKNQMKHIFSTPYHPQTNGIVEKANGTIITKLRLALADKPRRKWNTLLADVIKNYNNTPHDTTGFTPNFLLFGQSNTPSFTEPIVTIEQARQLAKERTRKAQNKRKEHHDSRHKHLEFQPGDRVLRIIPDNHPTLTKTSVRWFGPYFILERTADNSYRISETLSGEPIRAHVSQLKQFVPREQILDVEESET